MEIPVSSVSVVPTDLDVGLTSALPWEPDDARQRFDEASLWYFLSSCSSRRHLHVRVSFEPLSVNNPRTVHADDLFICRVVMLFWPSRYPNRITFAIIEQQSHGFVLLLWGTPKVQPCSTARGLFQDNSAKRGWAWELILWDDASGCNCNPHWHKLAGLVSRVIGCHLVGLFDLVFPHWGTCWCYIHRQPLNQRLNFLRFKFLILALIH